MLPAPLAGHPISRGMHPKGPTKLPAPFWKLLWPVPGHPADGAGIASVYDYGDGRVVIQTTDGNSYGPFSAATGPQGPPGTDGAPGPMGEVSAQQLSDAIAGTANNVNAIEPMNLTVSDPPTQSEMQTIANKLDELINALKRV